MHVSAASKSNYSRSIKLIINISTAAQKNWECAKETSKAPKAVTYVACARHF